MPAMITLDTLTRWLTAPAESEHLEFKEAKQQFDTTKLLRYCVALANEGGGHLALGVSDRPPRKVVGTQAFAAASDLNDMKARIVEKLRIRVEAVELAHPDGRVLVFEIPSRPAGHPLDFDGGRRFGADDARPVAAHLCRGAAGLVFPTCPAECVSGRGGSAAGYPDLFRAFRIALSDDP
jgi:predicted HTH transcriptional regulator